MAALDAEATVDRVNIALYGATGAGKSTLLNAIFGAPSPRRAPETRLRAPLSYSSTTRARSESMMVPVSKSARSLPSATYAVASPRTEKATPTHSSTSRGPASTARPTGSSQAKSGSSRMLRRAAFLS